MTLTVQGASFASRSPRSSTSPPSATASARRSTSSTARPGLRGKLANAAFVARAPEEVVDEQRARLEAAEEETAVLRAAQARLAGL